MKAFNRIFFSVIMIIIALVLIANFIVLNYEKTEGKPYLVEVSRLISKIENNTFNEKDLEDCEYITDVAKEDDNFYNSNNDYVIREINGNLYRFDYTTNSAEDRLNLILKVNIIVISMAIIVILVMLYIKLKILIPFEKLRDVPYELSKGNLTVPLKESKNRFFGRYA